ncbi:MAG: stage II sporulation protein R [Firmicutes bacterium HGW-Firmicutes-14]|jgi:stage II sporulation protein R|nr:MAG: stage II sporulation protein R [Firmicutes bacterium HGW-Firmicutes-14]
MANMPGTFAEAYNHNNLIRFHVIANSDSERDQALKRKIRDLIISRMTPEFEKAKSAEDARRIARQHLEEIRSVALEEIKAWGEEYPVEVQQGNFEFPAKTYGRLTLPAGNYEAVRVIIGQGQGANWWCVLFPPLCFVDVSKAMGGPVPETPDTVPDVSPPAGHRDSMAQIGDLVRSTEDENENVKIRFKILEIFNWSF